MQIFDQEPISHEPILMTQEEIKKSNIVDPEIVDRYFTSKKTKIDSQERYDLVAIFEYNIQVLNQEQEKLKEEINSSIFDSSSIGEFRANRTEEQIKLLNLNAEIRQIQTRVANGELISAKEIEQYWSYNLIKFKAKLEAIPSKTALQLSTISDPQECEQILTGLFKEALLELEGSNAEF